MKRKRDLMPSDADGSASGKSFGACVRRSRTRISVDAPSPTSADREPPGEAFTASGQKSLIIRVRPNLGGALSAEIARTGDHGNTGPLAAPFVVSYAAPAAGTKPQRPTTLTIRFDSKINVVLQRKPVISNPVIHQSLTPLWDKRLRAFPPEIRNQIFEEMLRNTWKGRTPNLIKALRGSRRDQDMYYAAMYAFYTTNCYMLNHRNGWCFSDMPGSAIRTIRVLGVDIGYPNLMFHWEKLIWSLRSPEVTGNLYFQTLYLTDTSQADAINFTDQQRQIRNHKTACFLAEFVVWFAPRSKRLRKRKGLKHMVLSTQLDLELVYPLLQKISSGAGRGPRLTEISSTTRSVWFWDMINREDLRAPANMDLFEI